MNDREKLIELIFKGEDTTPCTRNPEFECDGIKCPSCEREAIADYLLANGVTFATDTNVGGKWTPTDERLPQRNIVRNISPEERHSGQCDNCKTHTFVATYEIEPKRK